MEPFIVEPREGELKVCVAYTNARKELEEQVAIVGGDEFLVDHFSDWFANVLELGHVKFEAGHLYTWRGQVCLWNGFLIKAEGSWSKMHWFNPSFELQPKSVEVSNSELPAKP